MIGWRGHLGKISPAPTAGRVIREFYQVVPSGIDLSITPLTVRPISRDSMRDMMSLVTAGAEMLAERGVDAIYLGGVPPLVMKHSGYDRDVIDEIERVSGLPACTDITGVMDAFRAMGLKRLVMAAPFEDWINELIKKYVLPAGFEIVHAKGMNLINSADRRALPIETEYTFTRQAFRECGGDVDGIYIPCGGWGTVYDVERLEQDLGKPVVTWFTAMIWWFLSKRGVREPIRGFGSLLASLSTQ